MKRRILWLIVVFLVLQVSSLAKERRVTPQQTTLTPDQALAAAHSATTRSGTSLQVLRQIQGTASTRDVAEKSREEADLHHVALYGDGIFLDVLNAGGFLVLESDPTTGNAISIYLVSSGSDGRPVIESHAVEGNVPASLATDLVNKTADFAAALLVTPTSKFKGIEGNFSGGRFPEYERPGEQSIFSIPHNLRKLKADEDQYRDLAALFGGYLFWPVRCAMSMPIYAANPSRALAAARQNQEELTAHFLQNHHKEADFMYDLQDLESIREPGELRDRISCFTQLDDFLEQALESEVGSSVFAANRPISTLALQLGSFGNENAPRLDQVGCHG